MPRLTMTDSATVIISSRVSYEISDILMEKRLAYVRHNFGLLYSCDFLFYSCTLEFRPALRNL